MNVQDNISQVALQKKSAIVEKYGEFGLILQKLKPIDVQRTIIERGIDSSKKAFLQENSLSLNQFAQAYSKDKCYLVIELWLYDLNDYAGLKNKMSPEQVRQVAILFFSEAYMLNFTEMALFFNRIKKGYYGDFYGVVDPIKFMGFLNQFKIERREAIERINMDNENLKRKQSDIDWMKKKENFTETNLQEISDLVNNFLKQTLVQKKKH